MSDKELLNIIIKECEELKKDFENNKKNADEKGEFLQATFADGLAVGMGSAIRIIKNKTQPTKEEK